MPAVHIPFRRPPPLWPPRPLQRVGGRRAAEPGAGPPAPSRAPASVPILRTTRSTRCPPQRPQRYPTLEDAAAVSLTPSGSQGQSSTCSLTYLRTKPLSSLLACLPFVVTLHHLVSRQIMSLRTMFALTCTLTSLASVVLIIVPLIIHTVSHTHSYDHQHYYKPSSYPFSSFINMPLSNRCVIMTLLVAVAVVAVLLTLLQHADIFDDDTY